MTTVYAAHQITWKKVKELVAEESKEIAIVSHEGYLLYSRDRRFEERQAQELYRTSLIFAKEKGKELSKEVMEENPKIFPLTSVAAPTDVQVSLPDSISPVPTAEPPFGRMLK